MRFLKVLKIGIPLLVVMAVAVFFMMRKTAVEGFSAKSGVVEELSSQEKAQLKFSARQIRNRRMLKRKNDIRIMEDEEIRAKPPWLEDAEIESAMTDVERELLTLLRAAYDSDDKAEVIRIAKIINKMQLAAARGEGREVPALLRRLAVQALGWLGGSCIPELVGFIADVDPEVQQDAISKLEYAFHDLELSDIDLAKIIVQLSQIVNDENMLDFYFMEIPVRMRNSVAVSTLAEIATSGTEMAREKVPEMIEFYTGEIDIDTIEKLEKWLEEHPDGEDDDYFYGGVEPPQTEEMVQMRIPEWTPPAQ